MNWQELTLSDEEVRRLEGQLDEAPSPALAEAHNRLARHYAHVRPNTALGHASMALALAREFGDTRAESVALVVLGYCQLELGEYNSAAASVAAAVELADDEDQQRSSLSFFGMLQMQAGFHEEALDCFDRVLDMTHGWTVARRAGFLVNRGLALNALGRHSEALELFEEVIEAGDDIQRRDVIAAALNNKGRVLEETGRLLEAVEFFEQALAVVQAEGQPLNAAGVINNLADAYLKAGEVEKARPYIEEGLRLAEVVDSPGATARALENCCTFYEAAGEVEQALESARQLDDVKQEMLRRERRNAAERSQKLQRHQDSKRAAAAKLSQLSPRELEVLSLLARGFANKQVAQELGISARTVEKHRAAIMEKIEAESFADLVKLVVQTTVA